KEVRPALKKTVVVTPTASASATPTVSATAVSPPSRVPAYVAFGVGGAALVLGAVAGLVAIAKFDDFTTVCSGALKSHRTARGDIESGRTLGHVSTVGFVAAGIGAAVGVTLLLFPPKSKMPAQARAVVGPTFIGLKGAF